MLFHFHSLVEIILNGLVRGPCSSKPYKKSIIRVWNGLYCRIAFTFCPMGKSVAVYSTSPV